MIRTILVPATASGTDAVVFDAALSVARMFCAHLAFLHVRPDPLHTIAAMGSGDMSGTIAAASLIDGWIAEVVERERQAEEQFRSFCDRERLVITDTPPGPPEVSAEWHHAIGREPAWMVEYGQACDLITIGRPVDGGGVSAGTLQAALTETGRPLLIPGSGPTQAPPDAVAIAWKPTPQAARAVGAAMPFLMKSKSAIILTAGENDRATEESSGKLAAALGWHGIKVSAHQLHCGEDSAAGTLPAAAGEMRAGLLVMGGYGDSRLQELVLGGFTRQVLGGAALPVLMTH
jgi:nucleotide-binding universal stress UspA family protein